MIKFSISLRDYLANAFGSYWSSATMDIYSGTQPTDPETTPTGDLLATVTFAAAPFTTATSDDPGVIAKQDVWSGLVVLSGTAGWFRMTAVSYDPAVMIDGTCGLSSDNPDAILDNKVLVAGGSVVVTTFGYTQPQ